MILQGSQRGNGRNLAAHLMKTQDNEHVRVHELRGFAADDLAGAFQESEAIARATKCKQHLFSLSLNPPEKAEASVETFEAAIDQAERRLGLDGQPRAVVFHEKEGRRHAHCVWSRIDAETMTARQMSFYKRRLTSLSRDLYLDHGWDMPRGLIESGKRDPRNFTLAEWQQAKRGGIDPRWLKTIVQDCWQRSDSAKAFGKSLEEHGFFLAKGDRRGHVVLDHDGSVHSLPRMLGQKAKDVRGRLGDGNDLPDVARTRAAIGERMSPAIRRHLTDQREAVSERTEKLNTYKTEMTRLHRAARVSLDERQSLETVNETRARAARLPKGLRGLWHRITGQYRQVRDQNERETRAMLERQAKQRDRLIEKQRAQRRVLQEKIKLERAAQARALRELRRDLGRYLAFKREGGPARARGRSTDTGLKLSR